MRITLSPFGLISIAGRAGPGARSGADPGVALAPPSPDMTATLGPDTLEFDTINVHCSQELLSGLATKTNRN